MCIRHGKQIRRAKEKDDKRFSGAWTGAVAMFKAYRAKGALIGVWSMTEFQKAVNNGFLG